MATKGSPKQYRRNLFMRCDDVFCMTISRNRVSAITVVQRTLLSSKRLRGEGIEWEESASMLTRSFQRLHIEEWG